MRVIALVAATFLAGAVSCRFPELPPLDELDGGADAAPVACVDTGPDTPDPTCPADRPLCVDGTCGGQCASDPDCSGRPPSESVCHGASGACVACDEDDVQAQPGTNEDDCSNPTSAVCDSVTHTCRACAEHSECFSGVCDAGVCVEQANVIYLTPVAGGGTDGGINDCLTPSTGCVTLHHAIGRLTATRKYILFKASATPYPARNNTDRADFNGVTAHVIGYGAEVNRNGAGLIIEIRGGANVTIEGLTIANAGGTSGTGILVVDSRLELRKATVRDNGNFGLEAISNSSLHISQSRFTNNEGGAIRVDSTQFVIVNNIIAGNGDVNNSTVGGVSLYSLAANNVFEFNTVAANAAAGTNSDGVDCTSPLVARNNIIVGSAGGTHVRGNCNYVNTLFGPDNGVAGTGNMTVSDLATFMFAADFHIGAGSVAAGKADSTGLAEATLVDIDGDARTPNGSTVDVGADEIP